MIKARVAWRLLLCGPLLLAPGCGGGGEPAAPVGSTSGVMERPPALSIAAASSLRFALDDLVEGFREAHPETGVAVTYGSSGNFYAQIQNGAPFDLYLTAEISYAHQLVEAGLARPQSLFIFADGRIALWVLKDSPIDIETLGLRALLDPAVRQVSIANPAVAPYGIAAEEAMRAADVYDELKPKLVLGESIAQALQFVESGGAQGGVLALSLVVAPEVAARGRYVLLPSDVHQRIEHGGVILTGAAQPEAAGSFRAFLMSDAARPVLDRYGFAAPEP
ncbi:MAG: molybdate ABC transporter substrate-binding protein [Vicinamibacterales bacterium]